MKLAGMSAGVFLALIGVVHISLTGQNYESGSSEALWFIGSGIMLIAAGLFTYTAVKSCERDGLIGAALVNIGGIVLSIMAFGAIGGAHVYLLLALFIVALASTIYRLFPRDYNE